MNPGFLTPSPPFPQVQQTGTGIVERSEYLSLNHFMVTHISLTLEKTFSNAEESYKEEGKVELSTPSTHQ